MKTSLELFSGIDPKSVISEIIKTQAEYIDYITLESVSSKNGRRYLFFINASEDISYNISEKLSCWIINYYKLFLMKDLLKTVCLENEEDFRQIIKIAMENGNYDDILYFKKYIVKKLTYYISQEEKLNMEGFVRFRLKKYKEGLMEQLLNAAEEFYVQKEYSEFIQLLKLYIESRIPMIDLLHIKQDPKGEFELYDLKKQKIKINVEKNTILDQIEIFPTREDMLLSILVALAPRRIILHSPAKIQNKNIINTITEIFGDRFSLCENCELCRRD